MVLALAMLALSCSKDMLVVRPDVVVVAEHAVVNTGEEVQFSLTGDANFIVFYPDREAKTGIPIKYYQEIPLTRYTYTYREPGMYDARFLFRNAVKNEESVVEQVIRIEVR